MPDILKMNLGPRRWETESIKLKIVDYSAQFKKLVLSPVIRV